MGVRSAPLPEPFEDTDTIEDLGKRFACALKPHGFTAFMARTLPDDGEDGEVFLVDWPHAWVLHYAANGYAAEDVALEEARKGSSAFTWRELQARRPDYSRRLDAACALFGWRDGFVVPVHEEDGASGLVWLAAPRLALSTADRSAVEETARAAYRRGRVLRGQSTTRRLTQRERQVLELVAEGYDDVAIAAALSVSQNTAHSHVERAKTRLKAKTRAQAVAIAVKNGLFAAMTVEISLYVSSLLDFVQLDPNLIPGI